MEGLDKYLTNEPNLHENKETENHWLDSIDFPNLYWIKGKGKNKAYTINNYPTKSRMIQLKEFLGEEYVLTSTKNLILVNRLFTKNDGESFEVKDILKDLEENAAEVFCAENSDFKQHHFRDYYIKLYPFLKEKYDLFLKEEITEIKETYNKKNEQDNN